MRTVFLASLRTHLRRHVAAVVAVATAVAFVVVVGVLTAGARAALIERLGAPYRNADLVVSPVGWPASHMKPEDVIAFAERLGENASAIGRASLPLRAGGRRIPEAGVGPISTVERWRWQPLESGRFAVRGGEAVADVHFALANDVSIGDRLVIGEGAAAAAVRVVGLVESPSPPAQADVYVTWPQLLRWRDRLHLGSVAVRGEVGTLPPGGKAQSPEAFAEERLTAVQNQVDSVRVMLLLFAGVAVFVAAVVVTNTFAILFAQRLRDFALLRCVGATRRQVARSVRLEAAAVGTFASLAGAVAGAALGYGLIAAIDLVAPDTPVVAAAPPPSWLLGGVAVGLVVTVAAAWSPTRRVLRVSPLAALRPAVAAGPRTGVGRARAALAVLPAAAGFALLAAAVMQHGVALMLAGGGALFAGVLLLGPVLVPRLIRLPIGLFGPTGRLAAENAARNPRRTATTAAALLVGVTLTTAALTGMATWRAALDEHIGGRHPIDLALTSAKGPVGADVLDRVRRTPGVERAIAVPGAVARVSGLDGPFPVVAAPAAAEVARDGGAFAQVEPGTIKIDFEAFRSGPGLRPGEQVTVRVGERQARLRVAAGSGWGPAGVVAPQTLAALTGTPEPHAVWVRAAPGADPARLGGDLDELADPIDATIENGLRTWESLDRQLSVLSWSVLGLLAVAIVIALIGVANTLGLSVLERVREHALLRALGLTRAGLRRTLAIEALLLSATATLLGTVLGVGFAWSGYETVIRPALREAAFHIPWPSLGAVVLATTLAGLLAAVLPARRAARVTPAAGLSFE